MRQQRKTKWKQGPEWVVYSPSKNANWGSGPRLSYLTYQDAKVVYDREMQKLTPEIRENIDWRVEERHWGCEIFTNPTNVDDDWGGF